MLRYGLCVVALLLSGAAFAAETPKSLGRFETWDAFVQTDKSGKTAEVCYAVGHPAKAGALKGRGKTYITVTNRPADKSNGVISVVAGYMLKKNAPVRLEIGKEHIDLYAVDSAAWARDDKAVVNALSKGKSLSVLGSSAKDENVRDDYALGGFPKALAAINKACGLH